MRKRVDVFVVIGVVLCAAIIIGECSIYAFDIYDYSIDVTVEGDDIGYSVGYSGSSVFDAILFDGNKRMTDVCIFSDERYDEHYGDIEGRGMPYFFDQSYVTDQYSKMLKIRGMETSTVDSKGLGEYIESTMSDPSKHAIVVSSYALPSSVYSGGADDPIMKWISAGGHLYWIGSEIGRYYHSDDGLKVVTNNQSLFLGSDDCINLGDVIVASDYVDNGFTGALSLQNSRVGYGMKVSASDLSIGYVQDGYASISFVGYGSGSVCIIAGEFTIEQMADIGQTIASGVDDDTKLIEHRSGNVCRGTTRGAFEGAGSMVYIYIGGIYTIYGGCYDV